MCGITGYIGSRKASDILIDGLKKLEYRGYDSCGIAVIDDKKNLAVRRVSGRVDALREIVSDNPPSGDSVGVGHTRWATHGAPSKENAHPHTDCTGKLVVVHNGIIENYVELKERLSAVGHKFKSQTDTEVIAHLIEQKIKDIEAKGDHTDCVMVFFLAFREALLQLRGSFAVASVWTSCPDIVLTARMNSPLVIGIGNDENFISSDVSSFLKYTKKVVFVNDGEIAAVRRGGVDFFRFNGEKTEPETVTVEWDADMAEKGGYAHFMLKEIHEQAEAVENTLRGRVLPMGGDLLKRELGLSGPYMRSVKQIQFVSCGTAYHASLVGRALFEHFSVRACADYASEFTDRARLLDKDTLVIAVSQSGETADTIHAVREARGAGARVLAVTNTVGSTLTREADFTFYTHCGPEIGVASTKAFLGQLAALYVLAGHFATARGTISEAETRAYAEGLIRVPRLIKNILSDTKEIEDIAAGLAPSEHFLFISRGLNYPIALEGALKIKEISYVHAEGYAAGEMKHGPIAIIYQGMPVIAIAPSGKNLELLAGNIEEASARGAEVFAITDEKSKSKIKASRTLVLPTVSEIFSPLLTVIPLQLFAYYVALAKKCDIDKPRNLAKSVTVR